MSQYTLLRPADCCLHIIDPQKNLMNQIYEADRVARVIKFVITCTRLLNIPALANTQYLKGLGPYVDELEEVVEGIPRPDKVEFSAYSNKETTSIVDGLSDGISTIIMVGVETHICIYQSAVGVLQRGLTPWIVADATSSRSLENHNLALERLRQLGAIVGPAEMLVYELLGKAGTPQFKELLPHIVEFSKENN
jgi:nicotinamidase-related amidase